MPLPIYQQIEARCDAITSARPDWPCRRGCDQCCRSLAEAPHVSAPEWAPIREAIAALAADIRKQILEDFADLPERGPVTCPLLDREQNSCRIYWARPAACRSYGYYMSRGLGLFCKQIEELETAEVVWGNQDSLEHALAREGGASRSLRLWIAESEDLLAR